MNPEYQAVLERNLMHMVEKEPEDYEYWGPKIKALSERLGC